MSEAQPLAALGVGVDIVPPLSHGSLAVVAMTIRACTEDEESGRGSPTRSRVSAANARQALTHPLS